MPPAVRRRPASARTRGVVASALALALLVLAAGCDDDPPTIHAPELSAADAATCRDLVDDLPRTLGGEDRDDATGDTAAGAAWGDPAIVLTCGVPAVDLTGAPPCTDVDGIGWVVQEGDDLTTFTADGYRPRVEVVVPDDYDQPAGLLTELTAPVQQHLQRKDRCLWAR